MECHCCCFLPLRASATAPPLAALPASPLNDAVRIAEVCARACVGALARTFVFWNDINTVDLFCKIFFQERFETPHTRVLSSKTRRHEDNDVCFARAARPATRTTARPAVVTRQLILAESMLVAQEDKFTLHLVRVPALRSGVANFSVSKILSRSRCED